MAQLFLYIQKTAVNHALLLEQLIAAGWTDGFQTGNMDDGLHYAIFAADDADPQLAQKETLLRGIVVAHDPLQQTTVQQAAATASAQESAARLALLTPGAAVIWTAIDNAAAAGTWAAAQPYVIAILRWIVRQIVRILLAHRLTTENEP